MIVNVNPQCDLEQKLYTPEPIEIYQAQEEDKGYNQIIDQRPSPLGVNCVKYAKSRRPDLPQGLFSLADKKRIATKKTPFVGAVGVTNDGYSGHLVIVESINGELLTVSEGNYHYGHISTRIISKDKIIGYF